MRIRGTGCTEYIRDGVYDCYFSLGEKDARGRYKRSPKRRLYTTSKVELRRLRDEYKAELEAGMAHASKITVSEYANGFHELRLGSHKSPRSCERENLDVRHIDELFAGIRLIDLSPVNIREAYAKARKTGRFSESEIHKINGRLRQILDEAVDDGLIDKNPAKRVVIQQPSPKKKEYPSLDSLIKLNEIITSMEPTGNLVAVWLMLHTGMRKGEALGLLWECVNLKDSTIYISRQFTNDMKLRDVKSDASNRTISIGDMSYLARWQVIQKELHGNKISPKSPVCTNKLGGLSNPYNFGRWFNRLCKQYLVDNLTCHSLRHAQATILFDLGASPKTVQGRLGHSDSRLTMDIYAHFVAESDRLASHSFHSALSTRRESKQK